MKSEANLPKLLDRLDSSIYDVNPNMLLALLKEEFQDNMEKQVGEVYAGFRALSYKAMLTGNLEATNILYRI